MSASRSQPVSARSYRIRSGPAPTGPPRANIAKNLAVTTYLHQLWDRIPPRNVRGGDSPQPYTSMTWPVAPAPATVLDPIDRPGLTCRRYADVASKGSHLMAGDNSFGGSASGKPQASRQWRERQEGADAKDTHDGIHGSCDPFHHIHRSRLCGAMSIDRAAKKTALPGGGPRRVTPCPHL